HHHAGPVHPDGKLPGFADGSGRVVGEPRLHFDGNSAVLAAGPLVDGGEDVAGGPHVIGGDIEDCFSDARAAAGEVSELVVVVIPGAEGLGEDRRVRGDHRDVTVNVRLEVNAVKHVPGEFVEPDRHSRLI